MVCPSASNEWACWYASPQGLAPCHQSQCPSTGRAGSSIVLSVVAHAGCNLSFKEDNTVARAALWELCMSEPVLGGRGSGSGRKAGGSFSGSVR